MSTFGLDPKLKYTELALDSADATVAGDGSNNKYSWPLYYYTSRSETIVGLKVIQAEIPFVFDTITNGANVFIFTENGVPNQITITPGSYTAAQLESELSTKLAAVSAGFTVTWNSQKLKFTFNHNTAVPWSFYFDDTQTPYLNMGFLPNVTYANTGVSSITSPNIAHVTGPYYLYLNSTKIGSLISFDLADGARFGGSSPAITRIPLDVGFGSVVFYKDPDPEKYFDFFAGQQFDTFDFYLTLGSDQNQVPIDMKGTPWSIKLGLVSYRKASQDMNSKPLNNKTVIG